MMNSHETLKQKNIYLIYFYFSNTVLQACLQDLRKIFKILHCLVPMNLFTYEL